MGKIFHQPLILGIRRFIEQIFELQPTVPKQNLEAVNALRVKFLKQKIHILHLQPTPQTTQFKNATHFIDIGITQQAMAKKVKEAQDSTWKRKYLQ